MPLRWYKDVSNSRHAAHLSHDEPPAAPHARTQAPYLSIRHPMDKPYSPSSERNRTPILTVLQQHLTRRLNLLEIGSGTGQHAVYFAAAMPHLRWQTSDVAQNLPGIQQWLDEAALSNTPAPLALDVSLPLAAEVLQTRYDAVYTANTLHIMSWEEVQHLFAALPMLLTENALLIIYGPFNYKGKFTSESNAQFDASLRSTQPHRGIRDFEAVEALALTAGLRLLEDVSMPANNRCLIWRKMSVGEALGARVVRPDAEPPGATAA